MAAFGISFPKISLCRASTSKPDANHVSSASSPTSTTTPAATTTTATRTLSLSIKNVPSRPLHYDVSSTAAKMKVPTMTTILAIDGETKQLPKSLSVFNELQLDERADDIAARRQPSKESSDAVVPSSSSSSALIRSVDHRADMQPMRAAAAAVDERRSNQTFTPPTSSLSHESPSSNDLHSTLSALSVDLPPLNYALEKFLVDGVDATVNDSVYEVAEEFSSGCALTDQDGHENAHRWNVTAPVLSNQQQDVIELVELHTTHEECVKNETLSPPSPVSGNNIKWYVSELRIHQPLIYRTQWTNNTNRPLSHSVNDLTNVPITEKFTEDGKYRIISRKTNDIAHSTLSLQNIPYQQSPRRRSDDHVLLNNYLSCTDDDDFQDLPSDDDNQRCSRECSAVDGHLHCHCPCVAVRTSNRVHRPLIRDDSLIRNESVKKKLFDILNDDELENACLEDMSDEVEAMSVSRTRQYGDLPMMNSFSSTSSDDEALYSSPPNELQFPPSLPLLSSSSYHENLSTSFGHTTEYYLGRSRLITSTSLEKIPSNHYAYDHPLSSCTLRASYGTTHPSWFTSPSPQWRTDDPFPLPTLSKRHTSGKDERIHLDQLAVDFDVPASKPVHHYKHALHRQEPIHVSYPSMGTSSAYADDVPPVLPVLPDKSSNLLMFI